MSDSLSDEQLKCIFDTSRCPDCKGTLLAGPEGGGMINILCRDCHQEFNVDRGFGLYGHRNGPCSEDRRRMFGSVLVFTHPEPPVSPVARRGVFGLLNCVLRGGL